MFDVSDETEVSSSSGSLVPAGMFYLPELRWAGAGAAANPFPLEGAGAAPELEGLPAAAAGDPGDSAPVVEFGGALFTLLAPEHAERNTAPAKITWIPVDLVISTLIMPG